VDHNSSVVAEDDQDQEDRKKEHKPEGKATFQITFWLKNLDDNLLKKVETLSI
jgi:hypothetical protein